MTAPPCVLPAGPIQPTSISSASSRPGQAGAQRGRLQQRLAASSSCPSRYRSVSYQPRGRSGPGVEGLGAGSLPGREGGLLNACRAVRLSWLCTVAAADASLPARNRSGLPSGEGLLTDMRHIGYSRPEIVTFTVSWLAVSIGRV